MAVVTTFVVGTRGPVDRRLLAKLANLRSPEPLEKLGNHVASKMANAAPVESGLLRGTLASSVTPASKHGNTWWVGVGAYDDVGSPTRKAPRGTIRRFLKDYPKYKQGVRYSGGVPFNPQHAWWYLSAEAQEQLDLARAAGAYGGAVKGKVVPAYWYLQESGSYPSPLGGIPKDFVKQALADIRAAARSVYSFMDT